MEQKRCLAITGTFLPYNDVTTQLVYKQLRLLPFKYDVCALGGDSSDPSFVKKIKEDPNYRKFTIATPYKYRDATFSIKNPNLIKLIRFGKVNLISRREHPKRFGPTLVLKNDLFFGKGTLHPRNYIHRNTANKSKEYYYLYRRL